jgi:hypothetical protein
MMKTLSAPLFFRPAAIAAIALLLGGCVGMKLSAAGAQVAQATPAEVTACQLVGKVTSSIPSRTLNKLSPGKVREQLIVLARNEAAGLDGDTIAPAGPMIEGQQEFNVFRCR